MFTGNAFITISTERDFMNAVIEAIGEDSVTNSEIISYAKERIKKLDERNAVRRSKAKELKPEDVELVKHIKTILTDSQEPLTAKQIVEKLKTDFSLEKTPQKITAICKKIEAVTIKQAITGKNKVVSIYTIAK